MTIRNGTLFGVAILLTIGLSSCGQEGGASRGSSAGGDSADKATTTGATKIAPEEPGEGEAPFTIPSLFHDQASFDARALATGRTSCAAIDDQADLDVEPWPAELKDFLAGELAKFPNANLLKESIEGIYLVSDSLLGAGDLTEQLGAIAGLMCDTEDDSRGRIFMNHKMFVTERREAGPLGKWQDLRGVIHPHVLAEHGDQALYTLIHEVFHAIDSSHYFENDDPAKIDERARIMDMAWNSATEPKFEPVDILALRTSPLASRDTGFHLDPIAPGAVAEEYRKLVEDTNFISPYAMANAYEDFADTLSTYYFLALYDNGLVRTVYQDDLTAVAPEESVVLYVFDTKEILKGSKPHRDKMCAMVGLVFPGEDCQGRFD